MNPSPAWRPNIMGSRGSPIPGRKAFRIYVALGELELTGGAKGRLWDVLWWPIGSRNRVPIVLVSDHRMAEVAATHAETRLRDIVKAVDKAGAKAL